MKKLIQIVLVGVFFMGIAQANVHEATSANGGQTHAQRAHTQLAANCPQGCTSCWDQCTKSDDCGSGHNCIRGACGTRCVAN